MKKKRNQTIFRIIIVIPFIIGVIGNLQAGHALNDSLYCTFCYYFVSVYQNSADNFLMELSRWTAPLVTVTGVLYALRGIFQSVFNYLKSLRGDSVVIYYDKDPNAVRVLSDSIPHSFTQEVSEENPGHVFSKVNTQICFFSEDAENLNFYEKNYEVLKDKDVYMKMIELDVNLFRPNNIHFFNLFEVISAKYWKKFPIVTEEETLEDEYHIAIAGSSTLTQDLLVQGILHNIFFDNQRIVYHIYGNSEINQYYKYIPLMNNDEIIVSEKSILASLAEMKTMDRIILTDRKNESILENLIYACPDVPLYYFAENSVNPARFFRAKSIHAFGQQQNVLTKENIIGEEAYRKAKLIHFLTIKPQEIQEAKKNDRILDAEWMKLDGFMQSSYWAIINYYQLYAQLLESGIKLSMDPKEIVKLEHIRWCRFYFLNHWQFGIPEDGALRDSAKRIHRSLVPFEELREEDINREQARVEFLISSHDAHKTE